MRNASFSKVCAHVTLHSTASRVEPPRHSEHREAASTAPPGQQCAPGGYRSRISPPFPALLSALCGLALRRDQNSNFIPAMTPRPPSGAMSLRKRGVQAGLGVGEVHALHVEVRGHRAERGAVADARIHQEVAVRRQLEVRGAILPRGVLALDRRAPARRTASAARCSRGRAESAGADRPCRDRSRGRSRP